MTAKPTRSWSIWFYRRLLLCYPADFRAAYGEEMLQVFATHCRQADGQRALLQIWLGALFDLLTNAMEETLMVAYHQHRLFMVTGLLFGLVAGLLGSLNAVTSVALVGERGEVVIAYLVLFAIAALALWAGLRTTHISKRVLTGLWVGLLVGVIASLIANTARVGYSIAFYDVVRHDPGEIRDWLRRGGGAFVDYLIADRIGGYFYTTLLLGFIGGGCGLVGGFISKTQRLGSSN